MVTTKFVGGREGWNKSQIDFQYWLDANQLEENMRIIRTHEILVREKSKTSEIVYALWELSPNPILRLHQNFETEDFVSLQPVDSPSSYKSDLDQLFNQKMPMTYIVQFRNQENGKFVEVRQMGMSKPGVIRLEGAYTYKTISKKTTAFGEICLPKTGFQICVKN